MIISKQKKIKVLKAKFDKKNVQYENLSKKCKYICSRI